MIKRIIFDIDNTLMDFPKHYEEGYNSIIKKTGYKFSGKELYNAIGKYETSNKYKYYERKEMAKLLSKELNANIDITFMNEFSNMYSHLVSKVPKEVIETLKYLSSKYELVTLSNWFTDEQTNRLKEAGILKYFKKVYGTDIIPMKPNKESFLSVIDNLKLEECLMIGDNLEVDIKIPKEMGMNVLYLNKKNIDTNYPSIKNIEELKEML